MKTLFNISAKLRSEKGVTLVYVAILLVVFLGMTALAVDIGYLMVSKNELQNAADAAALAGASYLYPQISALSPSPPDWGTATTQATNAIGLNKSSNTALTDGTVQTGYWNLAHTPYGLQGTGITPGPQDCAAVQVAVSRSAGHNSGPVQHWFAPVLGINTSDSSAVATAAMCSPGTAFTGATMPFAISEAAAKGLAYYAPFDIEVDGVKLCTKNGISTQCGQWTTLLTDGSNSNSWIKGLIDGTNSSPERSIGDSINIVPGTRASDYKEVINHLLGKDVLVPVVKSNNPSQPDIPDSPGGFRTIVGFVGFHIESVNKHGNKSYITGHMVSNFYAGGTGNFGPNYGAFAPPRLVQ